MSASLFPQLDVGLVADWNFAAQVPGSRVVDFSRYGNNGLLSGISPSAWNSVNRGLGFIPTDTAGQVLFGDCESAKPRSGSFTVFVRGYWVEVNVGDNFGGVCGWQSTANSWFDIQCTATVPWNCRIDDNTGPGRFDLTATTILDAAYKWITLAVVREAGSDWKLYSNGVLETSKGSDPCGDINPTGTTFSIGRSTTGLYLSNTSSGETPVLSHVKVYNRALSADDLLLLTEFPDNQRIARRRSVRLAAGPPSGFKPYWARRTSQILGGR